MTSERTWTAADARLLPSQVCFPCGRLLEAGDSVIESVEIDDIRVVHVECFRSRTEVANV